LSGVGAVESNWNLLVCGTWRNLIARHGNHLRRGRCLYVSE